MKTKSILSTSLASLALPALALGAAAGFFACTAEFEVRCPDGSTQTAGGGDVNVACTPNDQLPAGSGGMGGSSGVGGMGGSGGSTLPPPAGECQAGQKQCSAEGLSECGADGQWQAPAACEIGCDGAKNECVVPVQLAAGGAHACARLSDGTVRCWGANNVGQLGNGTEANVSKPVPVANVSNALDLEPIGGAACVRTPADTVLCWGNNNANMLSPSNENIKTPTDIGATDIEQVAPGGSHLCVTTKASKSVQCRGKNGNGQLGNGGTVNSSSFESSLGFAGTPRQLAAGFTHTCLLTTGGTVYCWGSGLSGENGSDGGFTQPNVTSAELVQELSDIESISLSTSISCAVAKNGTTSCWGTNAFGLLGRGPGFTGGSLGVPRPVVGLTDVAKVTTSGRHTCALKKDGHVWCWGLNEQAQLGRSCVQLTCEIDEPISGPGKKFSSTPVEADIGDVVDIAAGSSLSDGFTCAIKKDKHIYCWGANGFGQLGIGRVSDFEVTPQRVVWK